MLWGKFSVWLKGRSTAFMLAFTILVLIALVLVQWKGGLSRAFAARYNVEIGYEELSGGRIQPLGIFRASW